MTEEDEAFKDLEKRLRKQATYDDDTQVYRNDLLEEVARHIEQSFTHSFGPDTVASFAIYIRGMKR